MEENRPKVGVGVMVFKEGKILLGKRKSSHGAGEYSFPGGHLEHLESFEECVIRETLEEVNIEIQNIQFQFLSNVTCYAPKHYVHIGLTAEWKSGVPQNMEPEKCEGWDWYDLDNLPSPVFHMAEQAIKVFKNNTGPYVKE
jgi:8-oxo-dGTP diphosphatase